jgi:hypothetical protein
MPPERAAQRASASARAGERRSRPLLALAPLVLLLASAPTARAASRLELHRLELTLPGAPAAVVPADLDGDGDSDLAVLVAWTEWGQLSVEERQSFSGIEGLVEVLTIVPSLFDRREIRAYLNGGAGSYELAAQVAATSALLALDAGPRGAPLVALTDEGVTTYRFDATTGTLVATAAIAAPPVLAGSGVFLPGLDFVTEVSGDDWPDLLLPGHEGVAVHLGSAGGFATAPAERLPLPAERWSPARGGPLRSYPLPVVGDVDGDRRPDLLWRHPEHGWGVPAVARGLGGGRFAAARAISTAGAGWVRPERGARVSSDEEEPGGPTPTLIADLDGDGRAELVTHQEEESEAEGMRAEMREAGSPHATVRFHRLSPDLGSAGAAYLTLPVRGHAFSTGSDLALPGGLQDLDGDGKGDLVTMDLELKLRRLMSALVTQSVNLPVDFRVWCQQADGSFRPVAGLDLAGSFRVDVSRMRLRGMPSFSGDFDGDGRVDFVQLGRGRDVSIHRGGEGCTFPARPDLVVRMRRAPEHLELVRVRDLDGDRRADLMVIHPGKAEEAGESPPVTLELHLSGGGR